MLLHRYGSMEEVMALDAETAVQIMERAAENDQRERMHAQWCAQLPIMALSGKAVGFEEYYGVVTGRSIDMRPVNEILAELDELERRMETGTNGNGNI